MSEDLSLLTSADNKDGETISFRSSAMVNYSRISSVAGNELRKNLQRLDSTEVRLWI